MKTIKRIVLLCLIAAVVIGGVQIKGGYDKYKSALDIMPIESAISELQAKEHYTAYDDVPEIYYKALVAVEDRRFYKHKGFDIIGTARAVYNDIRAWELLEGGSTISQQLAKNLYFPKDNTLERKIAEIFMAVDIEKHYDKQQVLEPLYLPNFLLVIMISSRCLSFMLTGYTMAAVTIAYMTLRKGTFKKSLLK